MVAPCLCLRLVVSLFLVTSLLSVNSRKAAAQSASSGNFRKHTVSPVFVSEGAAVGDVNRDGQVDILAGPYWYEAPGWQRHLLHTDTLNPVKGYSTTFLNFCSDVNNDGWPDLIRFDVPGEACVWYENPRGAGRLWARHLILAHAGIETPLLTDVDQDGHLDIICNDAEKKEVVWLKGPSITGHTAWERIVISSDPDRGTHRYTHGIGWGDVNGDGRKDVIIRTGWWEAPANVHRSNWTFHPSDLGADCANMFVQDVDGDGDADVLSSSAHDYGIWWYEQRKQPQGESVWVMHEISKLFSQSHAMAMADINGDGHQDIITGKRYFAHNEKDPGAFEPAVLYWFEYRPGATPQWIPHEIDNNSGIGNSFVVQDMNKDGLPDIIVSNKKGVYCFEQLR